MKRHHIIAMLSFISGGLFAYMQFHHGDTDRAIRTGIICIILGIVTLLFEKLRFWLRPTWDCGAFSFLRGNGSPCGLHGGYRPSNFPIYRDYFIGSSPLPAGYTIR